MKQMRLRISVKVFGSKLDKFGGGNDWKRKGSVIIIIIMNFYSPVSNTRCHSIGHKMRIARIKIRVDSQGDGKEPREGMQF